MFNFKIQNSKSNFLTAFGRVKSGLKPAVKNRLRTVVKNALRAW